MKYDDTYTLISKLNKSYANKIESMLKERGHDNLFLSHGAIIFNLVNNHGITMLELSKAINKTPQTTTILVKKLVDLNYVSTYKDEKDKRITRVKILDKGKEVFNIILEISHDVYLKQYKGLSEAEINDFRKTLNKIIDNMK